MCEKSFHHQPPTWDSCGRSPATSPLPRAQAARAIGGHPTAVPTHSLARWGAAAPLAAGTQPSPSPGISAQLKRGRRCHAQALPISNHDTTSVMLQRTGRKRGKSLPVAPLKRALLKGRGAAGASARAQGLPQPGSPRSLPGHCHHPVLFQLRGWKLGPAMTCCAAERGHMS